ncbi:MAG: peptidoglycan DD-metalloendopeptidase family protein [Rickettsiales bacterium]|jgi:murein DD-endopeptidase MepM/ murein hydrolase activator NlpD|nr:peptidoglycan DD-metalloendopeptidase family protein [Rickettsiales bacterium]
MKKAKDKKAINPNCLAKIAMIIALLLIVAAAALLITKRGRQTLGIQECVAEVQVASGDTLSKLLSGQGVSGGDINTIASILKTQAGVSSLRANSDRLIFSRPSDDAPVSKIILASGPWKQVELSCENGIWAAKTIDIERDTRIVRRNGQIKDGDSFYVAGTRAGIPAGILADVYDLLAFEIDFERDVRAGQEFSVLFEENYSSGNRIDSGRVVAISFDALRGNVKMYRFKKSDGTVGYYDENGNGATKSLKRTPINNARISSSFSLNRKHPVLGFTRAHKGVDFRAGSGTPIPASGAGRVTERKYGNGWGNYITIKHNKTYSTRYAHMSKFAKGISVGSSVRQGQIIGYVGMTGVATGPHLHYEVMQNGVQVNPMTVKLPPVDNLDSANKVVFVKIREKIDSAIDTLDKNPDLFVQM